MIKQAAAVLSIVVLIACSSQDRVAQTAPVLTGADSSGSTRLTLQDAEAILGQKARLQDSSTTNNSGYNHQDLIYQALDSFKGKLGRLYYMYETYPDKESASKVYSDIKTANEKHTGFRNLQGVGDEAYFHSDGNNFCFVLARKGRNCIRMKVNKLTLLTSVETFTAVSTRIINSVPDR